MRIEGGKVFIRKREKQFPVAEIVASQVVVDFVVNFTPYERLLEDLAEYGYENVSWIECSFYSPEVFSEREAAIAMMGKPEHHRRLAEYELSRLQPIPGTENKETR